MSLRLRRGASAELRSIVPAEGELLYTTDTKRLYVGDGITRGGINTNSGYTGSAATGYTGSTGAGFTGSAGTVGYTGSAGTGGGTGGGYTGSVGTVGYTGSLGYQGSSGTIGYTGSRAQEDRLVNGSKTVVLGTDGKLTLPAQGLLINVNQITAATINRAGASTDTAAIQDAWNIWYGDEWAWRTMVQEDQMAGGPTRPWYNKPSWEGYPLLMNFNSTYPGGFMPGGGLPPNPSLAPVGKTAVDSYLAYKELVSNIDIVSGNKAFSFENTGELSLPATLVFKDATNAKIVLKTTDNFGYVLEDPEFDKAWTFNANGSLTFPNNTVQTTAWTGTFPAPANGDSTSGNANLVFYDGAWKNTSRLTINPATSMLTINGDNGVGGITLPRGGIVKSSLQDELTMTVIPGTGGNSSGNLGHGVDQSPAGQWSDNTTYPTGTLCRLSLVGATGDWIQYNNVTLYTRNNNGTNIVLCPNSTLTNTINVVTGNFASGTLTLLSDSVAIQSNSSTWTFGTTGELTLPEGSTIGETATTTVITPPGAAAGQSLVIRPTSQGDLSASGAIVPGVNLTITLTNYQTPNVGTITYTITGATAQQLGIGSLTGTFPAFSPSGSVPQTTSVVLPIPSNSTAATFTLTVGGNNPWNGTAITVTDNGVIESSHVHLVAGNPVTTDIYLGDDNQYVKIAKNGGHVVVGTNTNTNQWTFGTDGKLTLPGGLPGTTSIINSGGFGSIGADGSSSIAWTDSYSNPTQISAITADGNTGVVIQAGSVAGGPPVPDHQWTFNTYGNLILPNSAAISQAADIEITAAATVYTDSLTFWAGVRNSYQAQADNLGITSSGWPFIAWNVTGPTATDFQQQLTAAWSRQQAAPSSPPLPLIFVPPITASTYAELRSAIVGVKTNWDTWQALLTSVEITSGSESITLLSNGKLQVPNIIQTDPEEDLVIRTRYAGASSPPGTTIYTNRDFIFGTNGFLTFPDNTVQTTAYVSNITNTVGNTNALLPGYVMVRDDLQVRTVYTAPNSLNMEFRIFGQGVQHTISANNGTNIFGGTSTGYGTWTRFNPAVFINPGEKAEVVVCDHSYHKIYRVTAMMRDIPTGDNGSGSVYCTIEELK